MKHEHRMPPKNPAFVQENVRRAVAAWRELGARITDPADRERLRLMKLAIYELDELQSEVFALLHGLVEHGQFPSAIGDALKDLAVERLESARTKGDPA